MSGAVDEPTRTRGFKKKARTRGRLLDAAVEVIAEVGESFSISDVVARAEVANGTFYNYFVDRDALIDAVVLEVLSSFADDKAQEVVEDDPVLRFALITASALQWAAAAPVEIRALLHLDAVQRATLEEGPLGHLRADLAAGVATGRFEVTDEDAALDVVVGALVMAMRRIVVRGRHGDHERGVLVHLLRSLGVAAAEARAMAGDAVDAARTVGPAGSVDGDSGAGGRKVGHNR